MNVPVVGDKVLLRVAGQLRRQDPRTKAFDSGPGFDNIHQDGVRVSLLLKPFDGLKSTTVFEHAKANELAGGVYETIYGAELKASLSPVLTFILSFNGAYTHVGVDKLRTTSFPGQPFTANLVTATRRRCRVRSESAGSCRSVRSTVSSSPTATCS